MPFLKSASLFQGFKLVPVVHPTLPLQFDFSEPVACARKICEALASTSPNKRMLNCRVIYHVERRMATVISYDGAAHYNDGSSLTSEQAAGVFSTCQRVQLGDYIEGLWIKPVKAKAKRRVAA